MSILLELESARTVGGYPSHSNSFGVGTLPAVGWHVFALLQSEPNYGGDITSWDVGDNQGGGNTYLPAGVIVHQGNSSSVYVTQVAVSGGASFTVNATPTGPGSAPGAGVGIKLLAFSGLASSNLQDTGVTTTVVSPVDASFDTSTPDTDTPEELIIALLGPAGFQSLNSVSAPGDFIELYDQPSGDGAGYGCYQITSSTGPVACDFEPNVSGRPGSKGLLVVGFRAQSAPVAVEPSRTERRAHRRKFRRRSVASDTTPRGMFALDAAQPGAMFDASMVFPAVSAGSLKVWDGSSWVSKPANYWTGSAWTQKTAKRWNGSAWQ